MLYSPGAEDAMVMDPVSAAVEPCSTVTLAGPAARPAGTRMFACPEATAKSGASWVLPALSVI